MAEKDTNRTIGLIVGLLIIIGLAFVTNILSKNVHAALEFPLWAVALGLIMNGLLSVSKTRDFIMPAVRTELYLRIGLVLLGSTVKINTITAVGSRGIVQAIIMVSSVFMVTWWLGGKFKLKDTLRATMAAAISICGVSAAIAAAGAVLAKKEEIAYVTALVIFTALPLMIIMPYLAFALGLSHDVAGAWFGGNVDTTAAVVAAGSIHSEAAMEVASIVKMAQNALMGVAAFLLALYFTTVVEKGSQRPSVKVIWDRFPKFVLGFMLVSILVSTGIFSGPAVAAMSAMRKWAFTLAFICIGLEMDFSRLKGLGGAPVKVYLTATVFNTVLALGIAYLIFGGVLGL